MSKRSEPSSPIEEHANAKKQKLEASPTPISVATDEPIIDRITEDKIVTVKTSGSDTSGELGAKVAGEHSPTDALLGSETTKGLTNDKKANNQPKHQGRVGFVPWAPKPSLVNLPKLQPHWGVIPRPGGYERPSQIQPSARDSDGSVRPALWEDRKGDVRVKRGSRIIDGYDQAYHMWLPLMDLRPASVKNQNPRRTVVGYYYPRGMPEDWNDMNALNDLNKALQAAIRANSNKEPPFSTAEREILAKIFAEDPNISLLDAAELFNQRAHPVVGSERVDTQLGASLRAFSTSSASTRQRTCRVSHRQSRQRKTSRSSSITRHGKPAQRPLQRRLLQSSPTQQQRSPKQPNDTPRRRAPHPV